MSNKENKHLVNSSNNLATNLVKFNLANTHCIVCGKEFETTRVGKLYCSNRCKQFGHNHKDKIAQILDLQLGGINPQPITFFIDEYNDYNKKQKAIRRYKELERKKGIRDSTNKELIEKERLQMEIPSYLLNSYSKNKFTESEEFEFCDIENELDENLLGLRPRELSIEQWSFVKSLYPLLEDKSLFEFVSSLSDEFLEQLNLKEKSNDKFNDNLIIKNKFINHCNLIASGVIQFKKQKEAETF